MTKDCPLCPHGKEECEVCDEKPLVFIKHPEYGNKIVNFLKSMFVRPKLSEEALEDIVISVTTCKHCGKEYNYILPMRLCSGCLDYERASEINSAVAKAVGEYGDTFKKLSEK